MLDDLYFVIKNIQGCETTQQLETAKRLLQNFYTKYESELTKKKARVCAEIVQEAMDECISRIEL